MVVAVTALVVALGGTSYAVVRLPAGSVSTKQLKRSAVTRDKIRNNAIVSSAEASLAGVGSAQSAQTAARATTSDRATSAANSDHATAAGSIDKVSYRVTMVTVPPAVSVDQHSVAGATAGCDAGQHVVGGGVKVEDFADASVVDSYPDASGTAWSGHADNPDPTAGHDFTVYAICAVTVATG
jgi:hypothetical protein